jgi:hypothetical protein
LNIYVSKGIDTATEKSTADCFFSYFGALLSRYIGQDMDLFIELIRYQKKEYRWLEKIPFENNGIRQKCFMRLVKLEDINKKKN